MAKEKFTENPLARTTARPTPQVTDNSDLTAGTVHQPISVGLNQGAVDAFDALAKEYDVSRHALMAYACRYFIRQYRAGAIDISELIEPPAPQKKRLKKI